MEEEDPLRHTSYMWTLTLLLLCLGGLALLASATSYDFSATDPADDVLNGTSLQYGANPPLDILSVVASEEGDEVEVRLTLAGPHFPEGYYSVTMGDGVYQQAEVIWSNDTGFLGHDILGTALNISGGMDSGGHAIVWLFGKASLPLEADLALISAYSYFNDLAGNLFTDTVDGSDEPGPEPYPLLPTPDSIVIEMDFLFFTNVLHYTTLEYGGGNALDLFDMADLDDDARVSSAELEAFEAMVMDLFKDEDGILMSQNGRNAISSDYDVSVSGLESVNQGVSVSISIEKSYTYLYDNSTKHTFILNGVLDPPDGLAYWNVSEGSSVQVTCDGEYPMIAPNHASYPYINEHRYEFLLEGADMREKWNETVGSWYNLEFERVAEDDPDDAVPGYGGTGAVIALAAVPLLALVHRRIGGGCRRPS